MFYSWFNCPLSCTIKEYWPTFIVILSLFTFQVLLDACLSEAIVKYDSSKKQHYINPANNCIIQDTFILRDLLFDWRVWDKTSVNVWKLGFEAIEVLIDEKHPHMVFNRKQLQRARIVDKLLNICLVRQPSLGKVMTVYSPFQFRSLFKMSPFSEKDKYQLISLPISHYDRLWLGIYLSVLGVDSE